MEILHTFTDRIQREPIPKRAEQHRLSDFTVNISKESEIIPGKVIVATYVSKVVKQVIEIVCALAHYPTGYCFPK